MSDKTILKLLAAREHVFLDYDEDDDDDETYRPGDDEYLALTKSLRGFPEPTSELALAVQIMITDLVDDRADAMIKTFPRVFDQELRKLERMQAEADRLISTALQDKTKKKTRREKLAVNRMIRSFAFDRALLRLLVKARTRAEGNEDGAYS